MDKGIRFVLECCRALFNHAVARRHMPPYSENPFAVLRIDRIPIERSRPVTLFTDVQEANFFEACDGWQFPVFLTLALTGLRPGELCHLLLPQDLDLDCGILRVRNKPLLGWRVKTGEERDVPLLPELIEVLQVSLRERRHGPVFRRRQFLGDGPIWSRQGLSNVEAELRHRTEASSLDRVEYSRSAKALWRELGAVCEDRIRIEFMRLTTSIGLSEQTAPKALRHRFATSLQEGRVDPLVRNLLMGHTPAGRRTAGHGLGMTAVYTHTSPQTIREQMFEALQSRPAVQVARARIETLEEDQP